MTCHVNAKFRQQSDNQFRAAAEKTETIQSKYIFRKQCLLIDKTLILLNRSLLQNQLQSASSFAVVSRRLFIHRIFRPFSTDHDQLLSHSLSLSLSHASRLTNTSKRTNSPATHTQVTIRYISPQSSVGRSLSLALK